MSNQDVAPVAAGHPGGRVLGRSADAGGPVELVMFKRTGEACLELDGRLPTLNLVAGATTDPPSRIVDAVHRELGIRAAFLRVCGRRTVELEVLEDERWTAPAGYHWRPAALEPPAAQRAPWHRPGWLAQVVRDIDGVLAARGAHRRGDPQQFRHRSVTGMVSVPTSIGTLWYKAVLPIFRVEPNVVRWLGDVAPGAVPSILGEGSGWWISQSFPEVAPRARGHALDRLARLQIASIGAGPHLSDLGCPQRGVRATVEKLHQLSDRTDLFSTQDRRTLHRVLPAVERAGKRLEACGMPETILHGDLTSSNFLWDGNDWFIYDWTDACVGHPLADVSIAVAGRPRRSRERALASYLDRWSRIVPAADLRRAVAEAPTIGAAHQMVTYAWIFDAIDQTSADVAGGAGIAGLLRTWMRRLVLSVKESRPATGLVAAGDRSQSPEMP